MENKASKPTSLQKKEKMSSLKQMNFKDMIVHLKPSDMFPPIIKNGIKHENPWDDFNDYGDHETDLVVKHLGSNVEAKSLHLILKDIVTTPYIYTIKTVDVPTQMDIQDTFETEILEKDETLKHFQWVNSVRKYLSKSLRNDLKKRFYWLVQKYVVGMVELKWVCKDVVTSSAFRRQIFMTLLVDQLLPLKDLNGSNMGWANGILYRYDLNLKDFDTAREVRKTRGLATAQKLKKDFLNAFEFQLDAYSEEQVISLGNSVLEKLKPCETDDDLLATMRHKLFTFAISTELGISLVQKSGVKDTLKTLLDRARAYGESRGKRKTEGCVENAQKRIKV